MRKGILLLIIFILTGINLIISQDLSFMILSKDIYVKMDTQLYNNYDHEMNLDTSLHAKYVTIDVHLKNNSSNRYLLTNLPFIVYPGFIYGNCDSIIKVNILKGLSSSSGLCFSISNDKQNLKYHSLSGYDVCAYSRLSSHAMENAFPKNYDIINVQDLQNNKYLALDVDLNEDFHKYGINTIVILEPFASFDWTIVFKNCDLYSFKNIEDGKSYKFYLTYYQGNDIVYPNILIPNLKLFNGVINSNEIDIKYIH